MSIFRSTPSRPRWADYAGRGDLLIVIGAVKFRVPSPRVYIVIGPGRQESVDVVDIEGNVHPLSVSWLELAFHLNNTQFIRSTE